MEKIEYIEIRKAFLADFENNNTLELQYMANVKGLDRKIQKQTGTVQKIESEIEEVHSEFENVSNLETLFNIGGQALPINNTAQEKLNKKSRKLQSEKTNLEALKKQRDVLAKRTGKLSNNTYDVYLKIKKTDLSLTSIRVFSEYNNYDKIDKKLAFIFVVAHIEANEIEKVDKSYLDDLIKANNSASESGYGLMADKILDYRLNQELKIKVDDKLVKRSYNQMSANKTMELSYEEYCLSKIGSLGVTEANGMWIAEKLNSLFLKKGNSQFGEELAKGVKRALEFVIRMESMGSYNSFVLWRNIPLPEGMFTGGWALRCTDVNSSFRVWMRLYRKDITSACERSGNVRWRGMYRQLCVEFKDTFYHQLMDELVLYTISERCKNKEFWEGVEYREIVSTVCNYDEKNPVLSKEFDKLVKERKKREEAAGRVETTSGEERKVTKASTHTSTQHTTYRLTASHMVLIMIEVVFIPFVINNSDADFYSILMTIALEGFWGCVVILLLHRKKERMDRAKTIVSSFSGFAVNTIILGCLLMLEEFYLVKMGVDTFTCAMGVVVAAVVYVIYLLFVFFSRNVNGGDK
ncbi:MAG: hypothetical protein IIX48_05205 [Lachnospiraceae bacterium]|nr:hypothetical protein [Lachnospiraceae bacterium]